MANLNTLNCTTTTGNTGVGRCFLDFKNIIGGILAPKGYEIDLAANGGDLKATLLAAVQNSNKSQRLYPLYDFETTKDSSEDKTVQTQGTGAKHPVREGFNDWSFSFVDGGLTVNKNARKFNGNAFDFFFIDSEGKIMGITGSSATKLKAIPSIGGFFWANPWKLNDASKISEYMLQFVFNVIYSNDLVAFVKADFDLPSLVKGLKNLNVAGVGTATPGTYNVTIKDEVGTNMADVYPIELASITLIKAKNAANGLAIPPTTVTVGLNAAGESCFVVALPVGNPNYPGVGGFINFDLDTPLALATAGIDSYESTGPAKVAKN